VPSFEDLGLLPQIRQIAESPRGIVLVAGSTGSGKSTTLASMVDYINSTGPYHIITIEDPIEFVHRNKMSLVNQREVGPDTKSFNDALKHILRQDPDVVLIGEMRDRETIEAALTLAETGHLTFATLHTSNCVQTINRIIDVFPANQQNQVRTQLSFVLEGVFCQQLLPLATGNGRCLAAEIMIPTDAIRANIRDDKIHQVYSAIQTGGKLGMKTMNQSLYELYRAGKITYETALAFSHDQEDLKKTFQKVGA
ncbi:MAG: PilT/PilU family type 4a pilus ATPase, partial [Planctomycetota bacterium]|nr:PilT/PilU family type 4a pilus ATPase [Planctomycetota bacterium]